MSATVSVAGLTPASSWRAARSSLILAPAIRFRLTGSRDGPGWKKPETPDGALVKTFTIPPSGTVYPVVQWPGDGRLIHYSINQNNVTNIWSQAPEGGEPKQVTDFKNSVMTGFAWSRDGKQLACTRGVLARDAVLITDLGN